MAQAPQPADRLAQVEVRSIDHVPAAERHGKVRDQFTLWFALNANIFPVVLGGVLIFTGLDFAWACAAIVAGIVIGLLLVGFHAIQGPRLGVPQMIQSRGQFGFYGAVLVFAASIVLDFGFLAAQLVIQADAMNLLVGSVTVPEWIAILTVPVVVLTIYGYDWIHRWQRWMTALLGVTFAVIFVQALVRGTPPGALSGTKPPTFALFMGGTGLFVIAMVSWAPYVSDYSRYLPENVSRRHLLGGVPRLRDPAGILRDPRRLPDRAAAARGFNGGRHPRGGGQLDAAGDGGQPDRVRRSQRLHRDAGRGLRRQLLPRGAELGAGARTRLAARDRRGHAVCAARLPAVRQQPVELPQRAAIRVHPVVGDQPDRLLPGAARRL